MNSFSGVILIVMALAIAGSLTLAFVTIKYYWAGRGTPPLTGDARRRQRDEELRLRAKQIERAKAKPVRPRKPGFWDNTKST